MTAAQRAKKAQALINEVNSMGTPGPFNYHDTLNEVRRIVIDILVLIRDDALAEDLSLSSVNPYKPET